MPSAVRARISPILPWSQLVGRLPCVPEWTVAVIATRPRRSHYRLLEFGHASLLSLLFLLLRFPCLTPPPTLTGRREREMRKGQGYRSRSEARGGEQLAGEDLERPTQLRAPFKPSLVPNLFTLPSEPCLVDPRPHSLEQPRLAKQGRKRTSTCIPPLAPQRAILFSSLQPDNTVTLQSI